MSPYPPLRIFAHQIEGSRRMKELERTKVSGGFLADEYGLGKTRTVLLHLRDSIVAENRPTLVVLSGLSALPLWKQEISLIFGKSVNVGHYFGGKRKTLDFSKYHLILTTYRMLVGDHVAKRDDREKTFYVKGKVLLYSWKRIVLDNGHMIRNKDTRRSKASLCLVAPHKWIVTGAPFQNNDVDEANTLRSFIGLHRERTSDYVIRHNKRDLECIKFPELHVKSIPIEFSEKELEYYTFVETTYIDLINQKKKQLQKGHARLTEEQIDSQLYSCQWEWFLRLRQICDHPALVRFSYQHSTVLGLKDIVPFEAKYDLVTPFRSAKQIATIKLVEEIVARNEKVVVVSFFAKMLQYISTDLNRTKISYLCLTGSVNVPSRIALMNNFLTGSTDVLLMTTTLGVETLSMPDCNNVILLEPWWNPFVERAIVEKVYHMFQKKIVNVYRFLVRGTEEYTHVLERQKEKVLFSDSIIKSDFGAFFDDLRKDFEFVRK